MAGESVVATLHSVVSAGEFVLVVERGAIVPGDQQHAPAVIWMGEGASTPDYLGRVMAAAQCQPT